MISSALSELMGDCADESESYSGQGFVIPALNSTPKSSKGWTVWSFTDMDWLLMQGLPIKCYLQRFHCEDVEDGQRLLADCNRERI